VKLSSSAPKPNQFVNSSVHLVCK